MGILTSLFPQRAVNGLVASASAGDLGVVKSFINSGTAVDGVGEVGTTALIAAAGAGNIGVVKYLVQQGANIHHKTGDFTAIDYAILFLHKRETGALTAVFESQEEIIQNLKEIIELLNINGAEKHPDIDTLKVKFANR